MAICLIGRCSFPILFPLYLFVSFFSSPKVLFCDFLPKGCFPAPRAVLKPRTTSTCSNPFSHRATDLNSVTVFQWQFIFWDHVIYVTGFVYISSYHKSQISLSKSLLTHVCAACHYFFLMLFKRSDANYLKISYWAFTNLTGSLFTNLIGVFHKSDRRFFQEVWIGPDNQQRRQHLALFPFFLYLSF